MVWKLVSILSSVIAQNNSAIFPTYFPVTRQPTSVPSTEPSTTSPSSTYPTITTPPYSVKVVAGSYNDSSATFVANAQYSSSALTTKFDALQGMWTSTSGAVFVASVNISNYAGVVLRVAPDATLTVVAGLGPAITAGEQNVAATSVHLFAPIAIWGDSLGELFICEQSAIIQKVDTQGIITTIAGAYLQMSAFVSQHQQLDF